MTTITITSIAGQSVSAELVSVTDKFVTTKLDHVYLRFRRSTGEPASGTTGYRIPEKQLRSLG